MDYYTFLATYSLGIFFFIVISIHSYGNRLGITEIVLSVTETTVDNINMDRASNHITRRINCKKIEVILVIGIFY